MHSSVKSKDTIYILLFILISILFVFPFIHTGRLVADVDWLFHASRAEQIYLNLRRGAWLSFIATNTFQHTGSGSFLFYPYIFIYPWALFRFFTNPITAFYLWKALLTFLSLCISFYCMKAFSKNRLMSLLFAVTYVFNTYRLYLGFYVFGEYIASTFLPLVFYGFYLMFFSPNTKKENQDKAVLVLSIGMSLLIYSHLVSVVITLEAFMLILLIYSLAGNLGKALSQWKNVVKSIILTFLLCLPLCYMFIFDYIGKNITSTKLGIMLNLVQPLSLIINSSIDNLINANSIGIFLIFTFMFGWLFWGEKQDQSKLYMCIYLLGVFFLLIASASFPWYLFNHGALGVIQIPYRYLEFSAFFFSIIFAKLCTTFLTEKLNLTIACATALVLAVTIFSYWVPVKDIYTELKTSVPTQFSQIKSRKFSRSILDKFNYDHQFDYIIPWGETDYFPEKSITNPRNSGSIVRGNVYSNGKKIKTVKTKYLPNVIVYDVSQAKSRDLDLPCIPYHYTYVKVDGKLVNYKESDRGTVLISHNVIKKNLSRIEVGFNPGIFYYLCIAITISTWIVIIIWDVRIKEQIR